MFLYFCKNKFRIIDVKWFVDLENGLNFVDGGNMYFEVVLEVNLVFEIVLMEEWNKIEIGEYLM